MLVKNLRGTADKKCKCGEWLTHWKKFSELELKLCAADTCTNNANVGAHVQKARAADRDTYIVPLCYTCNKRCDDFAIDENLTPPVPANVSKTCGA